MVRLPGVCLGFLAILCALYPLGCCAQLKFVVEDFEGFADGAADLTPNGVFKFGNRMANIEQEPTASAYPGGRFITLTRKTQPAFGGWGKGMGSCIELDASSDHFNFYFRSGTVQKSELRIELQEDDNEDDLFKDKDDDSWTYLLAIDTDKAKEWQLISIPLRDFKDNNAGGDHVFNCNYKNGKLICLVISFMDTLAIAQGSSVSFDFICFSKGTLPALTHSSLSTDLCNLGWWSEAGKEGDFVGIANEFKKIFKNGRGKKLGVIHFFQPFTMNDTISGADLKIGGINKVIESGYIPLITLENRYLKTSVKTRQPDLNDIVEGKMDLFFSEWAKRIKNVRGLVLLRILHEFNGDWYPWCIATNGKNSDLFIKAFRHIHSIFKFQQVNNVKFIWCPNSMSVPQQKWNYMMDAYPGDEYVDLVGLDIYNGAGKESGVWRSFRKEGIENYFILTQQLPGKPLLVCEVASRERTSSEPVTAQTKAEWIAQLGQALGTDMSKIKLLCWFNEKSKFKITSSENARMAYLKFVLLNEYFKGGTEYLLPVIK